MLRLSPTSAAAGLVTALTRQVQQTEIVLLPSRWYRMRGNYNSHHLDGDDHVGKASSLAPGLLRVRCHMPTGYLIDPARASHIRLRPFNPGKITLMGLNSHHAVLPLSATNQSLLPPSAATTIVMCNVAKRNFSSSARRVSAREVFSAVNSNKNLGTFDDKFDLIAGQSSTETSAAATKDPDNPVPLRPVKGKSDRNPVKHFVDCVQVVVEGGKGGDGRISFLSVFAVEFAGPDGGDGGHGAHVIFRASDQVRDLSHLKRRVIARYGGPGGLKNMAGKDASHLYVNVPTGTLLRNREGELVGDLDIEGACFIAARGGAGGKGNAHFKTSVRQAPEIAESGAEGEQFSYTLELRTMADVGLIGFPNAGKSTLLTAISRARPKVASYPFTTLCPHLGMVQYSDFSQLAVADLPGLLPGAHRNHGLGLDFLRHVQRCSVLLFVLDMEQEEPGEQLKQLKFELEMYQPGLSTRPAAVLANKMDLEDSEEKLSRLVDEVEEGVEVIPVSGRTGINLANMLVRIKKLHDQYKTVDE